MGILFIGGAEDESATEELMEHLSKKGAPTHGRVFSAVGKVHVADLRELFSRVELFVGVSTGPLFIADVAGCKTVVIGTDCGIDQSPQGRSILVQNPAFPPRAHIMYPPTNPETAEPGMGITTAMVEEAIVKLL